mgnify:CR=1 FL=1
MGGVTAFDFMCFGVPCFLMITGKLQLNKKTYNMSKCLGKVAIPLAFWGTLFSLMEIVFSKRNFKFDYIFIAISAVLEGKTWAHLWYLYMIIGIYIAIPIIRTVVNNIEFHDVKKIILVLFVFNTVVVDLFKVFIPNESFAICLPITTQYVMFILLGWYLDKIQINNMMSLFAFDAFSILLMLVTSFMGFRVDSVQYNDIPTVLLSVSVFLTFKYVFDFHTSKIMNSISNKSYGIYILHMIPVNLLYKVFHFNPWNTKMVVLMWVGAAAIIFLTSALAVWCIQLLPGGKKLLP